MLYTISVNARIACGYISLLYRFSEAAIVITEYNKIKGMNNPHVKNYLYKNR